MASALAENNRINKLTSLYSCDIDKRFEIKIGSLEGEREKPCFQDLLEDPMLRYSGANQEKFSDLKVTCQVFSDGKPLSYKVETAYKAFSTRWSWNEWLSLPIRFNDLPRDAMLAFTVWDIYKPNVEMPVGGTSISVFSKNGLLRHGMFDLKLWPKRVADGSWESTTLGKSQSAISGEMDRLSKAAKKHHSGEMPKCEWMDRQTFRNVEVINEKAKRESKDMYLMIEFPKVFQHGNLLPLLYYEKSPSNCNNCWDPYNTDNIMAMIKEGERTTRQPPAREICIIFDPEVGMENLVESKHHKLSRSLRSGNIDKDLKPNAAHRNQLNAIMAYPPTKALSLEEQDLVWKFRFYLRSFKKGLAKFLQCVTWIQPAEAKQAIELLGEWALMDCEDSLELLSSRYKHPAVRNYAVRRLKDASSNEYLHLYLLQLVQAMKYEDNVIQECALKYKDHESSASSRAGSSTQESRGRMMDSSRSTDEEVEEAAEIAPIFSVESPPDSSLDSEDRDRNFSSVSSNQSLADCDLVTFLINRACKNLHLANFFFWYLQVEIEDQEGNSKDINIKIMYLDVMSRFLEALAKQNPEMRGYIKQQMWLMDKLTSIMKTVAKENGNRQKKTEKLRALMSAPELCNFSPMPLPLDPTVMICGLRPEKATLFKSSQMPSLLHFITTEGPDYLAIFKYGDDLRQDQLILQTISLMDKLFKKENMDLKLTPYQVLATSRNSGLVQYVESSPVAEILRNNDSILSFFKTHAPSEIGLFGVSPDVMETYKRSIAGYCVITYILGIGDRHLDNLMLTKKGNLFHIDFGFILGRDPKPYPPPMKFCKEMVEGMGGEKSEIYTQCRFLCRTAFIQLRRHANVILNLFALMVDANIHDIAMEPDKTVKKIQDKFRLEMDDQEVAMNIEELIDNSVSSLMAPFVEKFHTFTQYLKK